MFPTSRHSRGLYFPEDEIMKATVTYGLLIVVAVMAVDLFSQALLAGIQA